MSYVSGSMIVKHVQEKLAGAIGKTILAEKDVLAEALRKAGA